MIHFSRQHFCVRSLFQSLLFVIVGIGCLGSGKVVAQEENPRERVLLDTGWRFQKGDPEGTGDRLNYKNLKDWVLPSANAFAGTGKELKRPTGDDPGKGITFVAPDFDDSAWRSLNLPHDWGIEGPFDQALPGETGKLPWHGVGWYRKSFDVGMAEKSKNFFLQIDGAMSYSTVWLNGNLVGGWPYGYSSFQLDLSPYIVSGKNVLAIRLDNPKDSSRWYPGGGIYRHVWLVKTAPTRLAHWSVQVTTPTITPASATVNLAARIEGPGGTLAASIYEADPMGKKIGKPVVAVRFPPGDKTTPDQPQQAQLRIANPKLWNLEKRDLYVAVTYVIVGGKIVDQEETTFGIRTAKFTTDDGFLLNGKRVQIQGVCMHQDLGALGIATNLRAMQRQIEILQEMGVNAIRTSHNPPTPEFLDLCDRMGILVMDEFSDTWTHAKKPNGYAPLFKDWHEADLRALVRRDRNHPSVIMWSTGNEVSEQQSAQPEGANIAIMLANIVRAEDPTRPVTVGVSNTIGGYNGFEKTVDVFGYNYKPHDYGKFHKTHPAIPLYGSETSSTISSRGEYLFPVTDDRNSGKIGNFQMSSYDLYTPGWATTPEQEFKAQDENPFVAGEFVWTGFDYLGEPTPYNNDTTNLLNYHTPEERARVEQELKELGKIKVPSRSSYFGIVDLAGFKKDRFYLYQSRWQPELKMAHILPHWNWPERVGEVTPVHVYTSGDEAELFLNGKSLGKKKKEPYQYRLRWDDVKYEAGELKVVTYKKGQRWAEDTVKTTGAPAKLLLQADRATIENDGSDLSFVTVSIADTSGLMVPRSKDLVKFEISGPGEIVATDNGDPTDLTTFSLPERKAFNGLALVIVRSKTGAAGAITLTAKSDGLEPATVELQATPK